MLWVNDGRQRLDEVNLDPCPSPAIFDKDYPLCHLVVRGPLIFHFLCKFGSGEYPFRCTILVLFSSFLERSDVIV